MSKHGKIAMTAADRWVAIAPCRNEAQFLHRCLDSLVAQTRRPDLLLVVDDGSSDATPDILAQYAAAHPWIRVTRRADRGHRSVGPGVMEAFHHGLDQVDLDSFEFLCKLDLDLDLPPRYFETLIGRMRDDPRLGTFSGKPYIRVAGRLVSEDNGDDVTVGPTKFYRVACFRDIGGFTRTLLWDVIDCHRARQRGWRVASRDEPDLRFEHLRVMGSSHKGVLTGRQRYGRSQWFMGADPLFFIASAIRRMRNPPYVTGSVAMIYGYARAWIEGMERLPDAELRAFIRRYQRRALLVGKARAVAELEARCAAFWIGRGAQA
jgi:glycosyltransferase involved in cell wall biosynthesis